jgi:hypothetical protein
MRLRRRGWAFLGEGLREMKTGETIANVEIVVSVWRYK